MHMSQYRNIFSGSICLRIEAKRPWYSCNMMILILTPYPNKRNEASKKRLEWDMQNKFKMSLEPLVMRESKEVFTRLM